MNSTPTIAPMPFPDNEPTENSTLDELATYALDKQDRILARDKKNGEDLWLMGQALEWAYKKTPYGEWEKWWKGKGFKKTYVWQARTLHDKATLDDVNELGLTDALRKFDVVADKKPQAGTAKAGEAKSKRKSNPKEEEVPEPTEEVDEGSEKQESNEQLNDDLADEEEREFKEFEASIRKLTPKTKAVAIHHAMELLRDDLKGQEVDDELQETFGQIAQLAEELKGVSKQVEQAA